jgi:hypothetical protein
MIAQEAHTTKPSILDNQDHYTQEIGLNTFERISAFAEARIKHIGHRHISSLGQGPDHPYRHEHVPQIQHTGHGSRGSESIVKPIGLCYPVSIQLILGLPPVGAARSLPWKSRCKIDLIGLPACFLN